MRKLPKGPGKTVAASLDFAEAPRILVVEDHPVNRTLMGAVLTSLGCRVEMAEDGEQAIAAVMRSPHDLVFMDIQMPKMGGLEATRAIRELQGEGSRFPIVALSANALPEHRENSLAAGMDDHISKPVTRAEIAEALAHRLKGALAGLGARRAPDFARRIETLAGQTDVEALARCLPRFEFSCWHTLNELTRFVDEVKPSPVRRDTTT